MNATGTRRVVVGICRSLASYQALRYAVTEARRCDVELIVVCASSAYARGASSCGSTAADDSVEEMPAIFAAALGGMPADLIIRAR